MNNPQNIILPNNCCVKITGHGIIMEPQDIQVFCSDCFVSNGKPRSYKPINLHWGIEGVSKFNIPYCRDCGICLAVIIPLDFCIQCISVLQGYIEWISSPDSYASEEIRAENAQPFIVDSENNKFVYGNSDEAKELYDYEQMIRSIELLYSLP